MADPIQGQPGEPSQATAVETEPPVQDPIPNEQEPGATDTTATTTTNPAPAEAEVDWSKVDAEDYKHLKSLVGGDEEQGTPAPESPKTEDPAPVPTEGAVTDPPSTSAPSPANPTDDDQGPFGDKFRPRLGKLPKVKQETVQLVREMEEAGTPIDFGEAEKRVKAKYGLDAPPAEPGKDAEKPKTSTEIAKEIDDLWAERTTAANNADLVAMNEIDRKLSEARERKQQAASVEASTEVAQISAADKRLADEKTQVRKDFPDFADEKSPLSVEFQRVYDELTAEGSPILQSAPEKQLRAVAKMAAANLGIKPVDPKAQPPAPKSSAPTLPATPPTPRPVQPASGSARTVRPAAEQHVEQVKAIKTVDEYEKMKAALA